MLIQIETSSDVPIFLQLSNQIIELVASGQLPAGTALPSVRSLAADLSMNMHTVNKAYHDLEDKGVLTIIKKSGAVINPLPEEISADHAERIREKLKPILAEAIVLGMKESEMLALTEKLQAAIKKGEDK